MRNPPRQLTNSLHRKAYSQHSTLPPELDLVKHYLLNIADQRERTAQLKGLK